MKPRKYSLNEHIFDIIDTPEKSYWLGFIYCDGWIEHNKTLGLLSKDRGHVNKLAYLLETNRPISIKYDSKGRGPYEQLKVFSPYLVSTLKKYGIIPNKTYNHSVEVYIPSGELERYFWRGCIDGDGSFNSFIYHQKVKNKEYEYGKISLDLANTNLDLLEKFKFFVGTGIILKTTHNMYRYRVMLSGESLMKILDRIYSGCGPKLDRKWWNYIKLNKTISLSNNKSDISKNLIIHNHDFQLTKQIIFQEKDIKY